MLPIIFIAGQKGSGKDTVADMVTDCVPSVKIGLADPMKRFIQKVFRFSNETLWGPSHLRENIWLFDRSEAEVFFKVYSEAFLQGLVIEQNTFYEKYLSDWFNSCLKFTSENGGISARFALQTLGTEILRDKMDPDVHFNTLFKAAKHVLCKEGHYTPEDGFRKHPGSADFVAPPTVDFVLVPDLRFFNEAFLAQRNNCISIRVVRPKKNKQDTHKSEQELGAIPKHFFNYHIINDGSLSDLRMKVDKIVMDLVDIEID